MRECLASVSISDCQAIARSNGAGCETDPTKAFTEHALFVHQSTLIACLYAKPTEWPLLTPLEGVYRRGPGQVVEALVELLLEAEDHLLQDVVDIEDAARRLP